MDIHATQRVLGILFLISLGAAFAQNEARVISVPGAPLTISSYEARYSESGTYSTEGVRHSVVIKNVSDRGIVAFGIGFYAFDAFKRYMGSPLTGIAIEPIAAGAETERNLVWTQRPRASFTFKHYGIGVAYVAIVRFVDGSIWEADMDFVLSQLQTIEEGLLLDDLSQDGD